jgi:ATP-binding cassette, subfamily F, member 3
VFVSHDRYFVERLATRIVDVGYGKAQLYPGTYNEFLWSKAMGATGPPSPPQADATRARAAKEVKAAEPQTYVERKRDIAEQRKREKAFKSLRDRIAELEARIADREKNIKDLEAAMSSPGFYDDHVAAKPVVDQHQALMWEVGDLLNQWEMLQNEATEFADLKT